MYTVLKYLVYIYLHWSEISFTLIWDILVSIKPLVWMQRLYVYIHACIYISTYISIYIYSYVYCFEIPCICIFTLSWHTLVSIKPFVCIRRLYAYICMYIHIHVHIDIRIFIMYTVLKYLVYVYHNTLFIYIYTFLTYLSVNKVLCLHTTVISIYMYLYTYLCMYVYMYIYLYVYCFDIPDINIFTLIWVYTLLTFLSVNKALGLHTTAIHIYMHVYCFEKFLYMYIIIPCLYIFTLSGLTLVSIKPSVCIRRIYLYICIYIHIYVCMYICTYIYMYTVLTYLIQIYLHSFEATLSRHTLVSIKGALLTEGLKL